MENTQDNTLLNKIISELPLPISQYIGSKYISNICECGREIKDCNFLFKDKGIVTECCDRLYDGDDYRMVNNSILRNLHPTLFQKFTVLNCVEELVNGPKINYKTLLSLYDNVFETCLSGPVAQQVVYMHMCFISFIMKKMEIPYEKRTGIIRIYNYLKRYYISDTSIGQEVNGLTIKSLESFF